MSMRRSRYPRASPPDSSVGSERALWLAIALLSAVLVGAAAGLLTWTGGANPANAVLAGGGAFGAATLLLLTVIQFATTRRS